MKIVIIQEYVYVIGGKFNVKTYALQHVICNEYAIERHVINQKKN